VTDDGVLRVSVNAPAVGKTFDQFLANAKNASAVPAQSAPVVPVTLRTSAAAGGKLFLLL
jgi:hypothetical protein